MSALQLLVLYSGLIVLAALLGALLPILGGGKDRGGWLALAGGLMLGTAFFHMLPEAFEHNGFSTFTLVPLGFLMLFVLERYVLVHACEEPEGCETHARRGGLGWAAFAGLSIHTLFDGVALGSAVSEGVGLAATVAITAHKVPSSVSLATLFKAEGRSHRQVLLLGLLFGFMVPVGAALYFLLSTAVPFQSLAPRALAFSAGTFLYVAVSDVLPSATRHGSHGRRLPHVALFCTGLALTWSMARLLSHGA